MMQAAQRARRRASDDGLGRRAAREQENMAMVMAANATNPMTMNRTINDPVRY